MSQPTVLVTGASAFIGIWIVQEALERGMNVIGTVRSKAKGDYVAKVVAKYGRDRFSYVIVEDVEKESGFDRCVDVDYIIHVASPFHYNVEEPKELIDPAVNGTLGILRAAHKFGKRVKRVVITSSNAALFNPHTPPYTFTEADWNTFSLKEVDEKGKKAAKIDQYRASKTLAERAAHDFVAKEKPQFDIATINPPYVLGPIYHQVGSPDALNTSVQLFYDYLVGKKLGKDAQGLAGLMVDVRDVAYVHVQALVAPKAGGHRFPVGLRCYSWQDALDVVHNCGSSAQILGVFPETPKGTPGSGKDVVGNRLDDTNVRDILGLKFTPFEKTIEDMAVMLAEREKSGWKGEPVF